LLKTYSVSWTQRGRNLAAYSDVSCCYSCHLYLHNTRRTILFYSLDRLTD